MTASTSTPIITSFSNSPPASSSASMESGALLGSISGRHDLSQGIFDDENMRPSGSLPSIACPGMDEGKLLSMAKRARKRASASVLVSTPQSRELNKRRSQYYGEVFATREPYQSARERVAKDSMVVAELKTNVILTDEYTLITDLSSHLALRYQRSESSIFVTISHSACLLVSGSFDPAYILTITALSTHVAPATNKRNSLLVANFLKDALRVPENRGIIHFQAVEEENMATGGKTVLGQIEALEQGVTAEEVDELGDLKSPKPAGRTPFSAGGLLRGGKSLRGRKSLMALFGK